MPHGSAPCTKGWFQGMRRLKATERGIARWYGFGNMQLLPPLTTHTAMFLDFDGTLVDIAPRPDEVLVAPQLIATLQVLHDHLGGALAIISGRDIEGIDQFLAPLQLACAGEHGAQMRDAGGAILRME